MERTIAAELPEDLARKNKIGKAYGTRFGPNTKSGIFAKLKQSQAPFGAHRGIDENVISEHDSTAERFEFLSGQTADLQKSLADLENLIRDLDETIHKEFSKNFRVINEHFEHYFKILFRGGKAKLILEERVDDPEKDFEEGEDSESDEGPRRSKTIEDRIAGIDIKANPPGKKFPQSICSRAANDRSRPLP